MSKKNYKVDEKNLLKLEKDAKRVTDIKEKIKKLVNELEQIENDSRWLNYLGSDSCQLSDKSMYKFSEIHQILNYASNVRNIL